MYPLLDCPVFTEDRWCMYVLTEPEVFWLEAEMLTAPVSRSHTPAQRSTACLSVNVYSCMASMPTPIGVHISDMPIWLLPTLPQKRVKIIFNGTVLWSEYAWYTLTYWIYLMEMKVSSTRLKWNVMAVPVGMTSTSDYTPNHWQPTTSHRPMTDHWPTNQCVRKSARFEKLCEKCV